MKSLIIIFKIIGGKYKDIVMLTLLAFFASIAEVFSIGMIIPFMSLLADPSAITQNYPFMMLLISDGSEDEVITKVTILFILATVFSAAVKIYLLHKQTSYSYCLGTKLSTMIFSGALKLPYSVQHKQKGSDLAAMAFHKSNQMVQTAFMPLLGLVSSVLMILFVSVFLINIDVKIYMTILVFLGIGYSVTILVTRRKIKNIGSTISGEESGLMKLILESKNSAKDIKLMGMEKKFRDFFYLKLLPLNKKRSSVVLISRTPKYIIEVIFILLIVLIVLQVEASNIPALLPTLAVMALAGQKLLPQTQQVYNNIILLGSSRSHVKELRDALESTAFIKDFEVKGVDSKLDGCISLDNVSFSYGNKKILEGVSFKACPGELIAVTGKSGSGKSTLLDIAMGLLRPDEGSLRINGESIDSSGGIRDYQSGVAHVPQAPFVFDATIAENVAFEWCQEKIKVDRVKEALAVAGLLDEVKSKPDGIWQKVGDNGALLSGGQRQRLSIARAIYLNKKIYIMDEVTSAIDAEAEKNLYLALKRIATSSGKIFLFVTHSQIADTFMDKSFLLSHTKLIEK